MAGSQNRNRKFSLITHIRFSFLDNTGIINSSTFNRVKQQKTAWLFLFGFKGIILHISFTVFCMLWLNKKKIRALSEIQLTTITRIWGFCHFAHHDGIKEKQTVQRGRATLKLSAKSNLNTSWFSKTYISLSLARLCIHLEAEENRSHGETVKETSVSFILPAPG